MIYSLNQLRILILPILQSMPFGDEDKAADAIVELFRQDREARPADAAAGAEQVNLKHQLHDREEK